MGWANGFVGIRTAWFETVDRCYCTGSQELHFAALIAEVSGGPELKRITPSEVAQKLLDPVLTDMGVAIATNC